MVAVRKVTAVDVPGLAATLGRAFQDDPVMSWLLPDQSRRARKAARWFQLQMERFVLKHDQCYTTADLEGGAIWAPPGKWLVSVGDQARVLPQLVSIFGRRIPAGFRAFNFIEKRHPKAPHYYLAVLGTEPARQGKGIGSALMRPVLEICDREGVPAYLESSKERNVPLYRRHGFEVTEELDLPGQGPRVWLMWREPRPGA
jgi:GNAT superfamily N-acetyltransferase